MKKTKIIYLISTLSFLLWIGCSDNSVSNSGNNNSNSFSGKIENWHYGSNKKLKATASNYIGPYRLFIDSCMIDSTGNFSVKCITPPDSCFTVFDLNDSTCFNTVVVNPANTRYSYIGFEVYDSSGSETGILFRSSDSTTINHEGQTEAYYFCIDKSVTISGMDSCNLNGNIYINIWNANFSKGWNSLYLTYNTYNPPAYMKVTQSSSQPKAVKWYYNGGYNKNIGLKSR